MSQGRPKARCILNQILKPNAEQVKQFLSRLWSGAAEGVLALVSISKGGVHPIFATVKSYGGFLKVFTDQATVGDLYHCIGLLQGRPQKGRGAETDVVAIPGLWFDLDCLEGKHNTKNLPSREEALSLLKEFHLRPSLIVWSGGGLHVYWLFQEPLYFHTPEERQAGKDLSSRFQKMIILMGKKRGWKLDNTSDLVRVLRLPGTYNHKRGAVAVEIIEESGLRYKPEEFDVVMEPVRETARPEPVRKSVDSDLSFLPVSLAVKKLIREGEPPGSRSEAIMSVITSLIKAGLSDDVIIRIFEINPQGIGQKYLEKGSGRSKWLQDEIQRSREKFHPEKHQKSILISEKSEESEIRGIESREWSRWPVLQEKALSGLSGRFVELACRKSEADPAAVLITFLSRFAAECGSRPFMYIGDSKHYARIFGVIVGSSSKSRKGTSGKPVERLFRMEEIAADDQFIPARISPGPLSTGEGLIFAVRDPVSMWKVDKKTGQGEEVVIDPGVADKRLFVLDEEFATALIVTKREGNTLSTILRCSWDNGNLEPLTKSNRIKSTGSHIGIISHITLSELGRRLEETEAFSGFANRILWICARRQGIVPFPEPMPARELSSLQWQLKAIIEAARVTEKMVLDEAARSMWIEVYPDLSKDGSGLVGCVCDRAEAQVLRLAMIYSLTDSCKVIRPEHLESAIAMWRYCEESARFIFSGREINPFSNKIMDLLRSSEGMSTTDIYNAFDRHITKRQLEEAVTELVSQRKIEVEEVKGAGRPRNIFKAVSSLSSHNSLNENEKSETGGAR